MSASSQRVDLGDVSLAVEDHGGGTPLILLHGFPLSAEIWSPIVPALESVARVITPDLPGFGRSGMPTGGFGMDALAATIVRLADALGLDRFALGGHSMGGYVALRLLAAHPDRVLALLLVDSRCGADDEAARERRNAAIESIRTGGREAFLAGFAANLVGPSTLERAPRLVAELRDLGADIPAEALVGALEGMRERPDSAAVLQGLAVPALVLVGAEDALAPPEVAREMAALIPRATLAMIPGAGHTPSVERPVATAETIAAFLRSELSR